MQIIIADADKGVQVKLVELTKQWGYEVVEVNDQQGAIAALQQPHKPAVLILGSGFSKSTQLNLCSQAKVMAHVYTLLLSSPIDIGPTSEGMLAGANDYISIPIDDTELRVRLDVAERVLHLKKKKGADDLVSQDTLGETDETGSREKTSSRLLEQLKLREATLDEVGVYVFTKDMQGRYTYANQKVCQFFNCSLDKIISYDDTAFFSHQHASDVFKNDALVLHQGKTVESEERNVIVKTGETRYYETVKKPLLGLNGDVIGLLGVSTDITQRKKSEISIKDSFQKLAIQTKKLNEKKELYELVFEKTDNGIFLLNIEPLQFVDCNQQVLRYLGYATKEDILTKTPEDISPVFQTDGRESSEMMREMCALALEKGTVTFEWQYLTKKINVFGVRLA